MDQGYVCRRHSGPTLVVDSAVSKHFEVLCLVPLRRLGVVECIEHADAFDRRLRQAVHREWFGYSRRLKDGWRDVDDMARTASVSRPSP